MAFSVQEKLKSKGHRDRRVDRQTKGRQPGTQRQTGTKRDRAAETVGSEGQRGRDRWIGETEAEGQRVGWID